MQEERAEIALRVSGLCLGQEEEGANRLIEFECQIARILSDAHYLELTALSRFAAEVLANRIFVPEKLPRERLINDRNFL